MSIVLLKEFKRQTRHQSPNTGDPMVAQLQADQRTHEQLAMIKKIAHLYLNIVTHRITVKEKYVHIHCPAQR